MTTEVIYSIFVSSTYEDLREERAEIQKALLKLKCLPIGMELFPSADEETWDFIRRQITNSDYYIVVIAGKYGSIASDGVGYTEKEYDYAREIGKPILAFVHSSPKSISREKSEEDSNKRAKLDAFIEKVKKSPVSQFAGPHELATQVTVSFVDLRDRRPGVGYVRADQAVNNARYVEILEENRKLESEISEIKKLQQSKFVESDTILSFTVEIFKYIGSLNALNRKEMVEIIEIRITWGEVFLIVAEAILDNSVTSRSIYSVMMEKIIDRTAHDRREHSAEMNGAIFDDIKKKLYGWRLISFDSHLNTQQHRYNVWSLTEYGQHQYGLLMK